MIHVGSSEASLATLPGLAISLRHKQLGVLVAPPLALAGDRAELLGDDALLVGQTYVCEVSEHAALLPCHVEFTVQSQPARVALTLERAPAAVSLIFRALGGGMSDGRPEPFAVGSGSERRVSVSLGEHGRPDEDLGRSPGSKKSPKLERSRSGRSSSGSKGDGGRGDELASTHGSSTSLATSTRLGSTTGLGGASPEGRRGSATSLAGSASRRGSGSLFESPPTRGGGAPNWASGVSLPAGIRYEVRHKQTDQLVASGQTRVAEEAPRASLPLGRLFAREAYVVHIISGDLIEAATCEFLARGDGEPQEVTLMVRRVCGAVSVRFVSYEFGSSHWAAALQLPPDVRFEVRHKESSALAFAGGAGPGNKVSLPSAGVLFVGETFVLQALSSTLLKGAACEFVARSVAQEVELALERAVGDVSLSLRALDGRPLPAGIPFQVWHQQQQCVVCEGRTSLAASQVPCDPWFVNQGALYMGESYVLAVPAGHGWRATAASFVVGEAGLVQLDLAREEGRATLQLLNGKAGSGHWSELLPLPRDLLLMVRRAGEEERQGRVLRPELPEGAVRASVDVAAGGTVLLAHERYVLALQPSELVLAAAVELVLAGGGPSAQSAAIELRVPRAWRPAVVVLLTTVDGIALPAGIRLRAVHRGLGAEVAEATTDLSDLEVRCSLKMPEAFFVGEEYEVHVDAKHLGIAAAVQAFRVVAAVAGADRGAGAGRGADVVLELGRALGELSVRLFPARLGTEHWAARLPLPPQQLELLQGGHLVATHTVTWPRDAPEAVADLSTLASLYIGQLYDIRVVESAAVLPVRLQCAIEPMPQLLPLPLSRVWHRARVTLRSRQELPLPFGVRVEVRHKALGVLVAVATAGEEEAQEYERQIEAAQGASLQASAAQADQALAKLAAFMRGKEIYFAGAGDIEGGTQGAGGAPLAWAIEYPGRPAYHAQNEATLDGIAAILQEFEAVMLEVRGETGPAERAPQLLASHFGLDPKRDVQRVMDRLAEQRATACVAALVARGVAQERLYVTFQGRAGGVRTDFIPRSMADNATRAVGATARLAAVAAELGGVQFHLAEEIGLPTATTYWSVEHLDPAVRAKNLQVLRAVAAVMKDHPELRLEINCQTAAPLELPPATEGDALRAPEALCARFNVHALEVGERPLQPRVLAVCWGLSPYTYTPPARNPHAALPATPRCPACTLMHSRLRPQPATPRAPGGRGGRPAGAAACRGAHEGAHGRGVARAAAARHLRRRRARGRGARFLQRAHDHVARRAAGRRRDGRGAAAARQRRRQGGPAAGAGAAALAAGARLARVEPADRGGRRPRRARAGVGRGASRPRVQRQERRAARRARGAALRVPALAARRARRGAHRQRGHARARRALWHACQARGPARARPARAPPRRRRGRGARAARRARGARLGYGGRRSRRRPRRVRPAPAARRPARAGAQEHVAAARGAEAGAHPAAERGAARNAVGQGWRAAAAVRQRAQAHLDLGGHQHARRALRR